jgi:hypothetical protein
MRRPGAFEDVEWKFAGALRKTLSARLIGVFEAAQEGARGL